MSRKKLVQLGEMAPDFTADTSDGQTIRLSDYRGRSLVVLIFYPADYTPGCTAQLCRVRDNWQQFADAGAVVFGVNPAAVKVHAGFASHHHLPFPLIYDKGGSICASYGCRMWFGIVKRTVVVVSAEGRVVFAERGTPEIERIISSVRAEGQSRHVNDSYSTKAG